MSFINAIGTANPFYKTDQMTICQYMIKSMPFDQRQQKILKYLYRRSGIKSRYSVLSDFSSQNGRPNFYTSDNDFNPNIESRLLVYDNNAAQLALKAVDVCLSQSECSTDEITHLICVSCTGMSAPGIDTELIRRLDLNKSIQRININFMGCFAAVSGLKLADTIVKADSTAKVLLVSVELCTLHFQNEISDDYNLSNMLFSDGSAAALISGKATKNALAVHGFHSDINDDGVNDMSWNISSTGFLMKLSSYVPKLLKLGFQDVLGKILDKYKIGIEELEHWAIHPGGKRIIDNIQNEFSLDDQKLESSRNILSEYGNMSSPTILFVLDKLQKQNSDRNGEYIFTAAFGPGLTTETALLSYV